MGRLHLPRRTSALVVCLAVVLAGLVGLVNGAAAEPSRSKQAQPGWALDRIDQRRLPLDHEYRARSRGHGVRVYVIDCGAQVGNAQFGDRAVRGANFAGGEWVDCSDEMAVGHATFVSGIIGGATTGVAKRVRLISVRALSGGEGVSTPPPSVELRRVVRAIDWVIADAARHDRPAVVNMSLAFHGRHQRLTDAITRLTDAGITAVVAAGNDGGDACRRSPANIATALTVGATNRHDRAWSGSNLGPCVDLFAPGVSVRSVLAHDGVITYQHSGATSWATPYVTGVAALYLSRQPDASPHEVRSWIRTSATSGRLIGLPANTANRLLYSLAPLG